MDAAAKAFFASKYFAVAGASQSPHKFGFKGGSLPLHISTGNASLKNVLVLAWYHDHSLPVSPITPSRPTISIANTDYPTLPSPSALPHPSETSLSIITQPDVTRGVLREAKEAGVSAVWLQPGSFDAESLDYAKREFNAGVGGEGGNGGEGWCVLVDGEERLIGARKEGRGQL